MDTYYVASFEPDVMLRFPGRVDLPLSSLPREQETRTINNKYYILQPRSARSKVRQFEDVCFGSSVPAY